MSVNQDEPMDPLLLASIRGMFENWPSKRLREVAGMIDEMIAEHERLEQFYASLQTTTDLPRGTF